MRVGVIAMIGVAVSMTVEMRGRIRMVAVCRRVRMWGVGVRRRVGVRHGVGRRVGMRDVGVRRCVGVRRSVCGVGTSPCGLSVCLGAARGCAAA